MPFASLSSVLCKNVGSKHFAEPNRHVLTFRHPKLTVQCTEGVALLLGNSTSKDQLEGSLGSLQTRSCMLVGLGLYIPVTFDSFPLVVVGTRVLLSAWPVISSNQSPWFSLR